MPNAAGTDSTSALLEQRIPRITQLWAERVRARLPVTAQDRPALRNYLPELLGQLVRALAAGDSATADDVTTTLREHRAQRARLAGPSIGQVLHEYCVLRAVLLEVLESEQSLATGDRNLILGWVEGEMRDAAEQFVQVQQQEFRTRDYQYRLLVENAREYAMFLTDRERRVTSWDAGSEKLLGYTAEEMVGQSGDIIFVLEDRADGAPEMEMRKALAEGRAQNERWHLRKDGSRFWGSGIMHAVYDDAGELVGFGKVMQDRTEFQHAQEERTRLLDQLQLADRRKNEFIAMLAHEMRSPLSAAVNSLSILDQVGTHDERVARQHAIIARQVLQLRRLIEDLLDVTRIVQGRVELRKARVDLRTVVNYAVQTSRPLITDRQHLLEVALPPTAVWVEADAGRLEQVVTNLLNNAARYTDPGGRVEVRLGMEGEEAVLRVRDTGLGIPSELLPRIFDLFTQGHLGTGTGRSGLGLGLTLVKQLVELHAGSVAVHSEGSGRGAEFTVRIPAVA